MAKGLKWVTHFNLTFPELDATILVFFPIPDKLNSKVIFNNSFQGKKVFLINPASSEPANLMLQPPDVPDQPAQCNDILSNSLTSPVQQHQATPAIFPGLQTARLTH